MNDNTVIDALSVLSKVRGLHYIRCRVVLSALIKANFLYADEIVGLECFDVIPSFELLCLQDCKKIKIENLNLPAYPLLRSVCLRNCPGRVMISSELAKAVYALHP